MVENKKIITHDDLVNIGYKWVMKHCGVAFKELKAAHNEIPDVLGFNSSGSFLLEAKTSRADYFLDKKKNFRQFSGKGVGDWRFFIIPEGLIRIEELPENWGLIEVNLQKKIANTYNPFGKGNIYSSWKKCDKSLEAEMTFMYSALRRLQNLGKINEIYKEK